MADNTYWKADELSSVFALNLAASDPELLQDKAGAAKPAGGAAAKGSNGAAPTENGHAAANEAPQEGEEGVSKRQLKKAAKNALKPKKEKDPNWFKPKEGGSAKEKKKKEAKVEEKYEYVSDLPKGHKKDLSGEMPAAYQPKYVEAAWQEWWEASGYYSADAAKAVDVPDDKKFVIVIPPPNVTGSLHLGHALTGAIQDTLTRWHRMRGDTTLYVPGVDHAGIATQTVVEKKLKKEQNITRHDLGREAFVSKVWEWKETYGNKITNQIRHMGSSVDWSREAFTMDTNLSKAVLEAFCRFHEDGLIYRDTRLVNWSCALKSAISDIEVDFIDLDGRTLLPVPGHKKRDKYEFGTLTSFAYPVEGLSEEIVVATTRLETMLGDTAVAVHPDDPRYTHLHGKFVVHPFNGRRIPIVTDPVLVDMSFGTGAVKITPAHDPNDYECGKRHSLEFINIFNPDGTVNANGAPFEGVMRYDARIAVEKALEDKGLLRGKEPNKMRLGICSRSGDIVEPYLTPQWYVKCDEMARMSVEAVRNGDLRILPAFHEQTWYRWLENIRDWCISRQLWWGHRIPAYFATKKTGEDHLHHSDQAYNDRWVVARSEEIARAKAAKLLGVKEDEVKLWQDEDVLDTWFSSGLFPFSVFGWPNDTLDMKAFYPTTLLETGQDILFFWVARMVMMGLQLTKTLPFKTVYLHAMVRDKYGRKMSKSLGNVIDPLEVIFGCTLESLYKKLEEGNLEPKEVQKAKEGQKLDYPTGIPECGTDALRFGLLAYTVQGRDVNLDIQRVVGYRNFCNKLWNATRLALSSVTDLVPTADMALSILKKKAAPRDLFILSRLNTAVRDANRALEEYQFGGLTQVTYSFWLYDLCDVYIELIKPVIRDTSEAGKEARWVAQACLYVCLDMGLRMLHPIMPFVTEELWQRLPGRGTMGEAASIMLSPYPTEVSGWDNPEVEQRMGVVKDVVHAARSLKAQYELQGQPAYKVRVSTDELKAVVDAQLDDISTLVKASSVEVLLGGDAPKGYTVAIVSDQVQVFMQLAGLVEVDKEVAKLEKKLANLTVQLEAVAKRLADPAYIAKVKEEVRLGDEQKKERFEGERANVLAAIESFKALA